MADEAREWPDAEVEKAARVLGEAIPFHGVRYSDKSLRKCVLAVLSVLGAVPKADYDELWELNQSLASDHYFARAEEAESQLAAVRAECENVAKELRHEAEYWRDVGRDMADARREVALERALKYERLADQLEGPVPGSLPEREGETR